MPDNNSKKHAKIAIEESNGSWTLLGGLFTPRIYRSAEAAKRFTASHPAFRIVPYLVLAVPGEDDGTPTLVFSNISSELSSSEIVSRETMGRENDDK